MLRRLRCCAAIATLIGLQSAWSAERAVPKEFPSIQAALDASAPGDTILIEAGRYTESLSFKTGVTLKGAGKEKVTVISPAGEKPALTVSHCASGAVSGVTFEGAKDTPSESQQAAPLCRIEESSIEIADCTFHEGKDNGIAILGKSAPEVHDCAALKNAENGILVKGPGAAPVLTKNRCAENGQAGIRCETAARAQITENICSGNSMFGILAEGKNVAVHIDRNTCERNKRAGITVDYDAKGVGAGNKFSGNDRTSQIEVTWLFRASDYHALETMAMRFRDQKQPGAGGKCPLEDIYDFVTEPYSNASESEEMDFLKRIDAWKAKFPESITPRVVLAEAYRKFAWRERGEGWSREVSEKGWKGFREYLGKSWAVIDEARSLNPKDPHYFVLQFSQSFDDPKAESAPGLLSYIPIVQVVRKLTGTDDPLASLFQQCAEVQPLYFPLYEARVRTLTPRWGGSTAKMVKFAETSAAATHDAAGDALYAFIARATYQYEGEESFKSDYAFSWDRIRQGNEDLMSHFGPTRYSRNFYCRAACIFKDQATAAKVFRDIADRWDSTAWSNKHEFDVWRKWAFGEAPYPEPSELEVAIRDEDADTVDLLIKKGANVNVLTTKGASMLSVAHGQTDSPQILQKLIEAGADVNLVPVSGRPALVDAVADDSADLMNTLLAKSANVNIQASDGWTPLTLSIARKKPDRANLLLQRGADPNLAYDEVWTPLRFALAKDYNQLVLDLIDRGANPNTNPDPLLANPLLVMAAEKKNNDACAQMLEHGADPNAAGDDNWTALFAAADSGGNVELARLLIDKGADVNARQRDGWSIFHMAVKSNSKPVLDLLVEKNPESLKFVTKRGRNLLHQAVKEGRVEITKFLLAKAIVDINAVDTESGKTALAYALENGNQEIVTALRAAGAKE
ncbi:MAG: ankyrin repeat domain-containing protein [Candidatus Hydrogenedentes bacterium]|nr:ankyrin repeat domain-containing protein [Candidatus Hydrogenedentota bacterium]